MSESPPSPETGGMGVQQPSSAPPSDPIPSLNDDRGTERQICDYCGDYITSEPQVCPALDWGYCEP